MKQFRTLIDGIRYQENCPLCKSHLALDERDFAESVEYTRGHPYQKFTFWLSMQSNDVVHVYPANERVELSLGHRFRDSMGTDGTVRTPYYFDNTIPAEQVYDGTMFQRLIIQCNYCQRYKYVLKMALNLTHQRIDGTFLNSEWVSVEKDGNACSILSIYSTERTEYKVFSIPGDHQVGDTIDFPLIPINLENPQETLNKIQKLVIFT